MSSTLRPRSFPLILLLVAIVGVLSYAPSTVRATNHSTATTVSCTPNPAVVDTVLTCTAQVNDLNPNPTSPTGTVTFTETGVSGTFNPNPCTLSTSGNPTNCAATFTPTSTGSGSITATYNPDSTHAGSSGTTSGIVVVGVTQPITLIVAESGAPTAVFSLSGCSVSPTAIVGDGNSHSVNAVSGCVITITTPADGGNTRYRFSGGATTTTVATCSSGTCPSFSMSYYYEIQNTYQASPLPSGTSWDSGLSIAPTGIIAGSAGTSVCTIDPTGASTSAAACSGWADYNNTITFPTTASGAPLNSRWAASGTLSYTDTTGGNVHRVDYYKQYQLILSYSVSGGGAPTAPIFTSTQFGLPSSPQLSTAATRYWFDYGEAWSITNPLGGSTSGERWQTNQAVSGAVTQAQTIAFVYFHQFPMTFAYTVSDGSVTNNPSVAFVQFGASTSTTATPSGASVWSDAGQSYTYDNPISSSTSSERWRAPATPTGTPTSSATIVPEYFHQFFINLKYHTSDGSLTANPGVTYTQFGSSMTATATTSGTSIWADATTPYTYDNPTSGSTTSERWRATSTPSGTILSSMTIDSTYYHQALVTLQYNIISPAGSGFIDPAVTFIQFGSSVTEPAAQSSPPSDWIDAGSPVTYTNPLGGSTSTERWDTTTISFIVSGSATLNPSYYHRLLMTLSYSIVGGGSLSAPTFTSSQFGSAAGKVLTATPTSYFFDAGARWSIDNPLSGSTTNERWQTGQAIVGTISAGNINFQYYQQFLVRYADICAITVSVPADEWVNTGANATGTFPSTVIDNAGTRCLFQSDDRPSAITAPVIITGFYLTQYYVQYAPTGCVLSVTLPAPEWVNSGSAATGIFPSTVSNNTGTRCLFLNDNRLSSITQPTAITGSYQTQYQVQYAQTGCLLAVTLPSGEWLSSGTSARGSFQSNVTDNAGTRCLLQADNRPATITAPTLITASYQTQYMVKYAASGCALTLNVPLDEWVNSGSSAVETFTSQVTGSGTRCNFLSDNRPSIITAPVTINATYQSQYLVQYAVTACALTVSLPASEWVDSGGSATGNFPLNVTNNAGARCLLQSDNRTSMITAPMTVIAAYQTQYLVTYALSGCTLTVNMPSSEWVNSSASARGVFASTALSPDAKTRCTFQSDSRPASIMEPTTIMASYQTQYLVHYAAIGCVLPLTVPTDEFVANGTIGTGRFPLQINGTGTRCFFVQDNRPGHISQPTNITGNYLTQYLVTYAQSGCVLSVTLPAPGWVNSGGPATGVFPSNVTGSNTQCSLQNDNRPSSITAPTTITATYQAQNIAQPTLFNWTIPLLAITIPLVAVAILLGARRIASKRREEESTKASAED